MVTKNYLIVYLNYHKINSIKYTNNISVEKKNKNNLGSNNKETKTNKKRKIKKAIKISCLVLAFLSLSFVLTTALLLEPAVRIKGYQTLDTAKLETSQNLLSIYDRDGIARQNMVSNKVFVSIDDVPDHVKEAFISIEDRRFYEHSGVDYFRIFGAARQNIKNRGYSEGASTISQQVIKNTHLSQDKNLHRKINEIRVARSLERRFSKNEIMEIYLNKIYFGNGAYGIGSAAKMYFGKGAADLNINEGAFLAAIINNPSRYNPYINLANANKRRRLVLGQMLSRNKISEEEYKKCGDLTVIARTSRNRSYGHSILKEAAKILGITSAEVLNREYKIYSYLDIELQNKIESIIRDYEFMGKEHTITHIAVMTKCGEVLVNFSNSHFNLSNFSRQPGSIIKPAIAYAPAFERRNFCSIEAQESLLATHTNDAIPFTPLTKINDTPKNFNGYSPKNFRNKNLGWTTLSESLKQSQNIPAVELVNFLGVDYCKDIAEKLGMKFDEKDTSLSVALGGLTRGVSIFEAAAAYRTFANNGVLIQHSHINKIINRNGVTIYQNDKKGARAISAESAYFINYILTQTSKNGTAKRIGTLGAAKTGTVGTTAGNTDAYIVAYTDEFAVAVWLGSRGNSLMPNSSNGSTHPSTIAKRILEILPKHKGFNRPSSIIDAELNANEYVKNNRLVLACDNLKPKDKFSGEFIQDFLPIKADTKSALNNTRAIANDASNPTNAARPNRQVREQRKQERKHNNVSTPRNRRNYVIID